MSTTVRLDIEKLYQALDAQRRKRGIPWRAVGDEIGCHPSTFTHMGRGTIGPSTNAALSMAAWLGKPLETYTTTRKKRARPSSE